MLTPAAISQTGMNHRAAPAIAMTEPLELKKRPARRKMPNRTMPPAMTFNVCDTDRPQGDLVQRLP